jgi:hypothetical protein
MCNLDCLKCTYDECINDGELDNIVRCHNWYEANKEKKRAYQREYARRKRRNERLGLNTPINVSPISENVLKSEYDGCRRCKQKRPIKARGLCNSCYGYVRKYGDLKMYDRKYEELNSVQQIPQ